MEAGAPRLAGGVRRSGKTRLARSRGGDRCLVVICGLPATEELLRDPVRFFRNCDRPVVAFDEIHQLVDPSRLLKIAADEFPGLRVLATGSSTLAASRKFRDTLTGRKRQLRFVPVLTGELDAFGTILEKRLYHGGHPPALLAERKEPGFYREWLDSFFARDIQRLFGFRDINRFNALFEYVLRQSGGQLETSRTAAARPTRTRARSVLRLDPEDPRQLPALGQFIDQLIEAADFPHHRIGDLSTLSSGAPAGLAELV